MKIAFVHYHLKTGGVTTVIRQQVEAIKECCEVILLTGETAPANITEAIRTIPGLGYSDQAKGSIDPEKTAQAVIAAICSKWKDGCDLIHVHNPTLAKNRRFLDILKALQARQIPLFLQIHDFAEDGRPSAYYSQDYVSNCHYGVINSRDYNILKASGLSDQGLHSIQNTINPVPELGIEAKGEIKKRILYPVRAIRRKNIGEAILLSLFIEPTDYISITLPPNSPKDIVSHENWKRFVSEMRLRVRFEEGLRYDFNRLVASAKFLITTSINEGFGFSFLEPWTAGKLLWGRKIPDICIDFEDKGILLDHLYDRLRIPIDWIGRESVYGNWRDCLIRVRASYGYTGNRINPEECFNRLINDGTIDFGLLNEGFQKAVIQTVISDQKAHIHLCSLNPFLSHAGKVLESEKLIQHNRKLVQAHYNMKNYRDTLLSIYQKVKSIRVEHKIDKTKLLEAFFNPTTFSLLKWCEQSE